MCLEKRCDRCRCFNQTDLKLNKNSNNEKDLYSAGFVSRNKGRNSINRNERHSAKLLRCNHQKFRDLLDTFSHAFLISDSIMIFSILLYDI
uniref:Uncharacterized protein n=1 Tax=Octopus bimaculoides TaxID=37653 RepID=A0A0L8IBH9_OCTBM